MLVVEGGFATCYGYIFDKKGTLIDGATHKHREGRKYPEWITRGDLIRPHSLFPTISYFQENVTVLTASTQSFYFHWIFDVLPRIGMLSNFKEKANFIFMQNKYRFQKETLKLLGISRNRIINTEDVAVLSAKKLLVPCHQVMKGREYPSWVIKYLRNQFLSGSTSTRSINPRIYIARRSAPCRKLINEPEIIDKLKNYGFYAVELERLSFQEQVQLFRNARAVVAPHGSGLANLVFCSPGIPVIELFPAANVDLYYRLSTALKLKYSYVKSRTGSNTKWTLENYPMKWADLKKTLDAAGIFPL
jgi:capsular polysaccharide biosynthesis protein